MRPRIVAPYLPERQSIRAVTSSEPLRKRISHSVFLVTSVKMIIVKEIIIKTPILGFLRFMDASLLLSGRGSELHGVTCRFDPPP